MGKIVDFLKKAFTRTIRPDNCEINTEELLMKIYRHQDIEIDGPDCTARFYRDLFEMGYINKNVYDQTIRNLESFLPPPEVTITYNGGKMKIQSSINTE